MVLRSCILAAALVILLNGVAAAGRKKENIRIGYLDTPGSALVLLAEAKGHFRSQQLQVTLVRYETSSEGLAALDAGLIDFGAFEAGEALTGMANARQLQVVAGGGTRKAKGLLAELESDGQPEPEDHGIVTVMRKSSGKRSKERAIRVVAALIRAHQSLQNGGEAAGRSILSLLHQAGPLSQFTFDPNPGYYRLEKLWNHLGLQRPGMKRDVLSSHVFEEIYCDALDRNLDAEPDDPILKKLFSQAVCVPDCCPAKKKKSSTKGGAQ